MISRARVGACVSEESRRCSLGATHAADRHQRCASDGSWALVMALRRAPSCYLILKAQCLITYCVATVSSEQCAARVDGTPPQTAYRLGRDLATPRVAVPTWTSPSNSLLHQERLPSNSYLRTSGMNGSITVAHFGSATHPLSGWQSNGSCARGNHEADGVVTEITRGGLYRIALDGSGHRVLARCGGKMITVTVFGPRPEQEESPFEAPPDGPHFDL